MTDKSTFIYVVDDDPSVTKALCRLIQSAGFRVQAFASAEELLELGNPETTDCLVLDVRLPGMNGIDLQKKLAFAGSKFPVIFITAYEDSRAEQEAMTSGAVAFLRKPFEDRHLLNAIRSAVKQKDRGDRDKAC